MVTKVGANVKDVQVGDHVGIGYFMDTCFECEYCEKDDEVNCLKGYTAQKEWQLKKKHIKIIKDWKVRIIIWSD